MKNGKLRRLGGLLALLLVLTCLLSMSAFAGANERYGYTKLDSEQKKMYEEVHDIVEAKTVYEIIIESDGSVEDWSPAYNLSEKCTVSYEDAVEVLRMFTADYPEYYWFDGTAGLKSSRLLLRHCWPNAPVAPITKRHCTSMTRWPIVLYTILDGRTSRAPIPLL